MVSEYGGNGWLDKSKGYYYVYLPNHPKAGKNKYIKKSIALMEQHLGRYLKEGEIVHHINENRLDDRKENLELMGDGDHASFHHAGKKHKPLNP